MEPRHRIRGAQPLGQTAGWRVGLQGQRTVSGTGHLALWTHSICYDAGILGTLLTKTHVVGALPVFPRGSCPDCSDPPGQPISSLSPSFTVTRSCTLSLTTARLCSTWVSVSRWPSPSPEASPLPLNQTYLCWCQRRDTRPQ